MIVHFRIPGATVDERLKQVREQLIRDNCGPERVLFADFILGEGDAQFGVLGYPGWRVFVYAGVGILDRRDIPTLGVGSGGMWDEGLNKFLAEQFRDGRVERAKVIEWVQENTTPSACAAYYDAYRYENG